MNRTRSYYRVEELVKCKLPLWRGTSVVRIAKRKKKPRWSMHDFTYFVTAPHDPVGYGAWVTPDKLVPLSPLEALAHEAAQHDDLGGGD